MMYVILAEICLTIGAPNWVVALSWVCGGLSIAGATIEVIKKALNED